MNSGRKRQNRQGAICTAINDRVLALERDVKSTLEELIPFRWGNYRLRRISIKITYFRKEQNMNSKTSTLTMSVEEAAQELGICVKIAYDLTHRQDFPTIKIGRRTRISREGLREWVRQQEQNRKETIA